jgi:hypothetical protein
MRRLEFSRSIHNGLYRKLLDKQGLPVVKRNLSSEKQKEEADPMQVLVCRQCRKRIADETWRISVDGGHRHSFANPHGLVYEIGCFESAVGCMGVGPTSNEFAWFKGYSWQVVICAGCLVHLGWFFQSAGQRHFYGLIFDRLVSSS